MGVIMKPVAILSCDTNESYLACLPIVCKSWQLQGFDVMVMPCMRDESEELEAVTAFGKVSRFMKNVLMSRYYIVNVFSTTNKALYTQCVRLYVPRLQNQYCILSDADMFIASSFLYRDFDKINVFGHDLTGFNHVPICYTGMTTSKWAEVMGYGPGSMEKDLALYADKDSKDPAKAWVADQDILTAKLKNYGFDKINFINRGTDPKNLNLPLGRIDRYNNMKRPAGEIHDCHLPRNPLSDENFPKIVDMCETIYPRENWGWLYEFRKEFQESIKQKV